MKKLALYALFLVPAVVLASSGNAGESHYFQITGRETDFVPRLVNFIIFVGLLYYLLANPIKNFFKGRQAGIESQLKEIEEKLQAAKDEKKEAEERVDEAEARALQIIEDAKKEAVVLAEGIARANETELAAIEKQFEEKLTLEEKKSAREVIDEVLGESITNDEIMIGESKVVEIVKKKVA
ncbi:F0F1 ATP synthase subunit B family protein [Sulfurovum mangrovi]|uniref:F0F1 ATP synthase subunit B family protein n=1 Tax=Sulfurovum mangrovi TaxID=2893889 RepID=UPI001E5E4DDE|nr:F0F1 ATP synthase subunit B [Sulfurovum mangrovi]UFH58684.1 F0F1 ATP synthase subunit B [Sulfurovum mangrovi]